MDLKTAKRLFYRNTLIFCSVCLVLELGWQVFASFTYVEATMELDRKFFEMKKYDHMQMDLTCANYRPMDLPPELNLINRKEIYQHRYNLQAFTSDLVFNLYWILICLIPWHFKEIQKYDTLGKLNPKKRKGILPFLLTCIISLTPIYFHTWQIIHWITHGHISNFRTSLGWVNTGIFLIEAIYFLIMIIIALYHRQKGHFAAYGVM